MLDTNYMINVELMRIIVELGFSPQSSSCHIITQFMTGNVAVFGLLVPRNKIYKRNDDKSFKQIDPVAQKGLSINLVLF